MNMQKMSMLIIKLCALLAVIASAAFVVRGYATAKNAQEQSASDLKFDVQIKKQHLLGEKIPVMFSLMNQGYEERKVRDIAMTRFKLKLAGTFNEEEGPAVHERIYDGSNGVVEASSVPTLPSEGESR